jgi:hypothetical protein
MPTFEDPGDKKLQAMIRRWIDSGQLSWHRTPCGNLGIDVEDFRTLLQLNDDARRELEACFRDDPIGGDN